MYSVLTCDAALLEVVEEGLGYPRYGSEEGFDLTRVRACRHGLKSSQYPRPRLLWHDAQDDREH